MKNRRMTLSQSSSLWEVCGFDKAITFIGAGGKTTSVKKLGDEIASQGYPVVLTTTTKVYPDQFRSTWESNEKAPPLDVAYPCFWYGGYHIETGKWIGPALESIDREIVQSNKSFFNKDQTDAARLWIIEGDGARGLSIKCWAHYEPQIPLNTQRAVLVIDARIWGAVLNERLIHRPEHCKNFIDKKFNADVCWDYLLLSPVFKPEFRDMSWIVLFNQKESEEKKMNILKSMAEVEMENFYLGPKHLRIAAGNVKEGLIYWEDLW